MKELTKEDKDFIITALNAFWHDSHELLSEGKNLGDMEKEILEFNKRRARELLVKMGAI